MLFYVMMVVFSVGCLTMAVYGARSGEAYLAHFWFKRSENPVVYWSTVIFAFLAGTLGLVVVLVDVIRSAVRR